MSKHSGSVTKACFFHLRRIRQIKRCLNELMSTAFMSWSRHLCYPGLTIVTRCFVVCQIPPSHHSPLSFTPQLVYSKKTEITSLPLYVNYTGCPSRLGFPLKSVY